jgi:hypothetical protein
VAGNGKYLRKGGHIMDLSTVNLRFLGSLVMASCLTAAIAVSSHLLQLIF